MRRLISRTIFDRAVELLAAGESSATVARTLRISYTVSVRIAKGEHLYQRPAAEQRRRVERLRGYTPTPTEIAAACAEIRASRGVDVEPGWMPPVVSTAEIERLGRRLPR